MLAFLYTADYEIDPEYPPAAKLNIHPQIYTLADKYDVPALMRSWEKEMPSTSEVYILPSSGNRLRKSAILFARERLKTDFQEEDVRTAL